MPSVNVRETYKSFELEMAAPGYGKKDFNLSIDNNLLTVSAEKKHEQEKTNEHYTRREFGYESFSRSFNLPANTKLFAIPFTELKVVPDKRVFMLDRDKSFLEQLPGFDKTHWPDTNSHYYDDVNLYWRISPRAFVP